MIKRQLLEDIKKALDEVSTKQQLNIPSVDEAMDLLNVERPRQTEHGDYAINVSPLAKFARISPSEIASIIAGGFEDWSPSITGGFINFQVNESRLAQSLINIIKNEKPGQNRSMSDTRCLLEFVSANPTGPLHIGHGRWVALGDSIGRIMRHCGAEVSFEFYINDAGSQIFNLANSIWYRSLEILGRGGKLPQLEEGKPYPFYPGEYVIDLAKIFIDSNREKILLKWDSPNHVASDEAIQAISDFARERLLEEQRQLMERCRLTFDVWFSERKLHEEGLVEAVVKELTNRGVTYEKDGAIWLASTRFGDDQDRVLIKSDGKYTYLTADVAYHYNKYNRTPSPQPSPPLGEREHQREGYYNLFINIWGADHHGYIARMKAAIEALGYDPKRLEIILGQLVNLIIEGERTRMGKRKKMLTLQELVDEVGVDAVRYWMVSKSQDTPLDFNVELAASASEENPVFYVQYAHARCCSILRNAFQSRFDTLSGEELPPLLSEEQWRSFLENISADKLMLLFSSIDKEQVKSTLKELILKLDSFEEKVLDAARQRSPHIIARYLQDLSADFHRFYSVCRILVPEREIAEVRLVVVYALKLVLAQALELLGISAPEQM